MCIINMPYNIKHVFDIIKKKRHWYHTQIYKLWRLHKLLKVNNNKTTGNWKQAI